MDAKRQQAQTPSDRSPPSTGPAPHAPRRLGTSRSPAFPSGIPPISLLASRGEPDQMETGAAKPFVQDFMHNLVEQEPSSPDHNLQHFTRQAILGYPAAHQPDVRIGIARQLPKLRAARSTAMTDLTPEQKSTLKAETISQIKSTSDARRREINCLYLDKIWGSRRSWLPTLYFPRDTPCLAITKAMRKITDAATQQHLPLAALWAPGGVLYGVAHLSNPPTLSVKPLNNAAKILTTGATNTPHKKVGSARPKEQQVESSEQQEHREQAQRPEEVQAEPPQPQREQTDDDADSARGGPMLGGPEAVPTPEVTRRIPSLSLFGSPASLSPFHHVDERVKNRLDDDKLDNKLYDIEDGLMFGLGNSGDDDNDDDSDDDNDDDSDDSNNNDNRSADLEHQVQATSTTSPQPTPAPLPQNDLMPQPHTLDEPWGDAPSIPTEADAARDAQTHLSDADSPLKSDTILAVMQAVAPDRDALCRRGIKVIDPLAIVVNDDAPHAKLPKLGSCSILLAPLHHTSSGGHWSLVRLEVVVSGQTSVVRVSHFDSLRRAACFAHVCQALTRLISNTLPNHTPEFTQEDCPQQRDGTSCGVFVLAFFKHLVSGLPIPPTLDPKVERRQFLDALKRKPRSISCSSNWPAEAAASLLDVAEQQTDAHRPTAPAPQPCAHPDGKEDSTSDQASLFLSGEDETRRGKKRKEPEGFNDDTPFHIKRVISQLVQGHAVEADKVKMAASVLDSKKGQLDKLQQKCAEHESLVGAAAERAKGATTQVHLATLHEDIRAATDKAIAASDSSGGDTLRTVTSAASAAEVTYRTQLLGTGWDGKSSYEAKHVMVAANATYQQTREAAEATKAEMAQVAAQVDTLTAFVDQQQGMDLVKEGMKLMDESGRGIIAYGEVQDMMDKD